MISNACVRPTRAWCAGVGLSGTVCASSVVAFVNTLPFPQPSATGLSQASCHANNSHVDVLLQFFRHERALP